MTHCALMDDAEKSRPRFVYMTTSQKKSLKILGDKKSVFNAENKNHVYY